MTIHVPENPRQPTALPRNPPEGTGRGGEGGPPLLRAASLSAKRIPTPQAVVGIKAVTQWGASRRMPVTHKCPVRPAAMDSH